MEGHRDLGPARLGEIPPRKSAMSASSSDAEPESSDGEDGDPPSGSVVPCDNGNDRWNGCGGGGRDDDRGS